MALELESLSAETPPALRARGLGKAYPVRPGLGDLLGRPPMRGIQAVAGLDLDLPRGTALGLVGSNGAGKSTLLRLLAGLAKPSSGTISVSGRVANLLDLGAGLVEDWTGAQNARRLSALLGADSTVGRAKGWVRAFAGLGAHWTAPVRTYSSGMRLRLAYAIAAAGKPDLLVVDEVLAVGDEGFQRRCTAHVLSFLEAGGTMIFASHNLYLVEHLCDQAIWLEGGRVGAQGDPRSVVAAYRAGRAIPSHSGGGAAAGLAPPPGEGSAASVELRLLDPSGRSAESLDFAVGGSVVVEGPGGAESVTVRDLAGTTVAELPVHPDSQSARIPGQFLLPGRYELMVEPSDGARLALSVGGRRRELGAVFLPHQWGPR